MSTAPITPSPITLSVVPVDGQWRLRTPDGDVALAEVAVTFYLPDGCPLALAMAAEPATSVAVDVAPYMYERIRALAAPFVIEDTTP